MTKPSTKVQMFVATMISLLMNYGAAQFFLWLNKIDPIEPTSIIKVYFSFVFLIQCFKIWTGAWKKQG